MAQDLGLRRGGSHQLVIAHSPSPSNASVQSPPTSAIAPYPAIAPERVPGADLLHPFEPHQQEPPRHDQAHAAGQADEHDLAEVAPGDELREDHAGTGVAALSSLSSVVAGVLAAGLDEQRDRARQRQRADDDRAGRVAQHRDDPVGDRGDGAPRPGS